jgi:16S rRNA (adenine1518-N6/adenine1519-N6)-dimethyltransferase
MFSKVVMAAFGQRRKTIRNTLKDYLTDDDFLQIHAIDERIQPQLRAENLSVKDYVLITNYLSSKTL